MSMRGGGLLKIIRGGELLRPILEEHEGNRIPEVDF
jgi:hypothetical protein